MALQTPAYTVNNQTLMTIRWVAFAGQLMTIFIALFLLNLQLPLTEVGLTLALLPIINGAALLLHRHRRLRENAATAYLALDIIQFSLLLFCTGGFENPFSMLIITPVAVAAAVLSFVRMTLLSLLSIAALSVISIWHYPLAWPGGELMIVPSYTLGEQIALVFAVVFVAGYVWRISSEFRHMQSALYDAHTLLTRQRQMAALGAQAAAAAHELGSPLSTIAIIARELQDELADKPEVKTDLDLLLTQSRRCSAILKDLSLRPERANDPLITALPVETWLRDLAAVHGKENPAIRVSFISPPDAADIRLSLTPEIARSLGNLIQNAVQHAASKVVLEVQPYENKVRILIHDDGPGFPPQILARVGEPYVSSRRHGEKNMGLGLFIAQTLIEHIGGQIRFRNHPKGGAEVMVTLNR